MTRTFLIGLAALVLFLGLTLHVAATPLQTEAQQTSVQFTAGLQPDAAVTPSSGLVSMLAKAVFDYARYSAWIWTQGSQLGVSKRVDVLFDY